MHNISFFLFCKTFDIIKSSALIYLEANYDPEMLMSYPNYPPFLKKRIHGKNGHLSNLDCAKAIDVTRGDEVFLEREEAAINTDNISLGEFFVP